MLKDMYRNRWLIGIIAGVAVLGVFIIFSATAGSPVFRKNKTTSSTTYYVSSVGSNEYTGKQADLPLATIQQALRQAQPGDTIMLADGEYRQDFKTVRSGQKDAPITIRGTRAAVVYGAAEGSRIIEIQHDYLTLDGFRINGQQGPGTAKEDFKDKLIYAIGTASKDGVEGLKLQNLLVENAGGECIRLRYFARNNEIKDSTIRNCGVHDFQFDAGGKNGEGIYIGTAPEQRDDGKNPTDDPDESTGNWVHHNDIQTFGNECVDIKEAAYKNIVEHNTCSKQLDPESGGFDSRGDENIFRYNKIFDNKGAGVRLGGDGDDDGINNEIYENEIRNNKGGPVKIMRQPQGKICGNQLSGNGSGDEESRAVNPAKDCP